MCCAQAPVGDPRPQDGMHLRHVRAPQHEGVGLFDVVIATHRLVDAKGAHEAAHRRCHAMPGIGLEIVRAETGFHQFQGGIALHRGPLAGAEHADRCRSFRLQGRFEFFGHNVEGFVPAHRREIAFLVIHTVTLAQQRDLQTILAVHDL